MRNRTEGDGHDRGFSRLRSRCSRPAAARDEAQAARRALRRRAPYRFTVKLFPPLVPAAVLTVTVTAPYLAAEGTLHLICVALQDT